MKRILCLAFAVLMLSSCGIDKKYEKTVFSMDTHITMSAYGDKAEEALDKAEDEISRIDKKFKVSNTEKIAFKSDEEVENLLALADEIKEKTNGAFDIRVAPVMRAWGFYSEEFTEKNPKVPTKEELTDAMLEMKNGTDLDFGAIAKGYCADRVVEILKKDGVKSAVLSLGGNVVVLGKNPNGKQWKVGVKSPFDNSVYATVCVSDTSLVTSGDYVRYFEADGKKYHHIIDTKTGYPAENDLTSVTIIDKKSAKADALSTALFVMGKEKAIEFWQKDKSFSMILIEKSGKILCTEDIELETNNEIEIIKGP